MISRISVMFSKLADIRLISLMSPACERSPRLKIWLMNWFLGDELMARKQSNLSSYHA